MVEINIPGIGKIEVTVALNNGNIDISIINKTAVNFYVDGELRIPA